MGRRFPQAVALVILIVAGPAVAEDVTITTYYPSPRGVYEQLRTTGDVGIGTTAVPVQGRLHIVQPNAANALRVDDIAGDLTPFVIDQSGNVGIGTASPEGLQVNLGVTETARGVDNIRVGVASGTPRVVLEDSPSATLWEIDNLSGRFRIYNPGIERLTILGTGPGAGNVGIGTVAPAARLAVIGQATFGSTAFAPPGSEPLSTDGGGSGISMADRTGGPRRVIYPSGDVLRFWRDTTGDQMTLGANGDIGLNGKHAFRSTDSWLRLNQDGAFTSGTHTPGLFAPGSLNVGGWNGWGNPGFGNLTITGNAWVRNGVQVCSQDGFGCPAQACTCSCP